MRTPNGSLAGRRAIVHQFGPPEVLRTVTHQTPPPGRDQVRLRVLAIGVGFTDLMARAGDYVFQPRPGFAPGYELVAEVIDTGKPEPDDELPPERLVAVMLPRMGAYADHVVVPRWRAVPLPAGLDPSVAATVPLDFLTAASLLDWHARLTEGDTVLIQGAGGGVGQAVSQLGRRKDLRMYGTASTPGSFAALATYDITPINYRTEDFAEVLRSREPDGIQAVFDHLGGPSIDKAYRVLAPGGVLVSHAFSGRPGRVIRDTVVGGARVLLGGLRPGRRTAICMIAVEIAARRRWYRRTLSSLLDDVQRNELRAHPSATFSLDRVADVHAALERRELTGKVVLTTADVGG